MALDRLGLSPHNVVGVGDAENDHAFLSRCECAIAVANALPMLQERADWITPQEHGAGVRALIDRLVTADSADLDACLQRHHILLGRAPTTGRLFFPPYGVNLLLAGTSGSGKTTVATGIMERLVEHAYQVCVIDPEGDYSHVENTIVLGSASHAPDLEEVLQLLENPHQNVVMNLLGLALEHRPAFFARLLPRLQELRARTGHPHWIVVDETHHLLPASLESAALLLPRDTSGMLMITVQPQHVAKEALALADVVMAIGEAPHATLRQFSTTLNLPAPALGAETLEPGHAPCGPDTKPRLPCRAAPCHHALNATATYASMPKASWGPKTAFTFAAQQSSSICAPRISWSFCSWPRAWTMPPGCIICAREIMPAGSRRVIKDPSLAEETLQVGRRHNLSATESRALLKTAIRSGTRRQHDVRAAVPNVRSVEGNDQRGYAGLWGLAGLLGLAGLAGRRRAPTPEQSSTDARTYRPVV